MIVERLALRCLPFSHFNLIEEVRKASGADKNWEAGDQVRYLSSYLQDEEALARSIVVEAPYVDRHFIEEFTGYYANGLRPPSSKTTRLHFFSVRIAEANLSDWLARAASGKFADVQAEMQAVYLGFTVVRPLPFAPIGRTLLRPYQGEGSRHFAPADSVHRVHLAGIELSLQGLPFQQQDQAVGACATTAIWTALARVMRADGQRPATPLAITTAATQHIVSARPFPAVAGLDQQQILAAIRAFGYAPDITKRAPRNLLQAILKCYVASGIPVILQVKLESSGQVHALALAGYRESETSPDLEINLPGEPVLRSRGLTRLYVHDDRLGPYARMRFLDPIEGDEDTRLEFLPRAGGFDSFREPAVVWSAIAPLYPKLRLSASDLIAFAGQLLPLMRFIAGADRRDDLTVNLKFVLGGHYLRQAFDLGLGPKRTEQLVRSAVLSRYVGLIRFDAGDRWFADVLCDTTDIRRDVPQFAPILAIIPSDEAHGEAITRYLAMSGSNALVI